MLPENRPESPYDFWLRLQANTSEQKHAAEVREGATLEELYLKRYGNIRQCIETCEFYPHTVKTFIELVGLWALLRSLNRPTDPDTIIDLMLERAKRGR